MTAGRTIPVVALVVLAGCLGTPGGSPTESDGQTPDPTATTTATAFEDVVELPDGPKERPERPDQFTRESVASLVETYEYRYAYNSLWYNEHSDVQLDCEVDSVEDQEDGWRVVVSCSGYSNTPGDDSTATATQVHADWFTQTFVYHVTDTSVTRERQDD